MGFSALCNSERILQIWDCCESNKLHSIQPTVGIVQHGKNVPLRFRTHQQTANWLLSPNSLTERVALIRQPVNIVVSIMDFMH